MKGVRCRVSGFDLDGLLPALASGMLVPPLSIISKITRHPFKGCAALLYVPYAGMLQVAVICVGSGVLTSSNEGYEAPF